MSRLRVAVVGSGPSGFYAISALNKACPDALVDIVERLPTPFGLIRAGVAPDHQTTKNVIRAYARTAEQAGVTYFGNVELGRDISLDELRGLYDAVILAVGAPADKVLNIPGIDLPGVHGSAEFVGWYNGHPDHRTLNPDLDVSTAVVIGNGNVAIDVARVLVKSPSEMADSDLPAAVADVIHASPIRDVYVAGRRGPADAKFTTVELKEMLGLEEAVSLIDHASLPETVPEDLEGRDRRVREKNLLTLARFEEEGDPAALDGKKRVHFAFYANPVEVRGEDRVTGVLFETTCATEDGKIAGTGTFFEVPCGLIVTAIGYRSRSFEGVPFDHRTGALLNTDGRISGNLFTVGWAKRGPSGVIGSSKRDGDRVAEMILSDWQASDGGETAGRAGLQALLEERNVPFVDYEDWRRIDAAEIDRAQETGAPREKFLSVEEMLAVLEPTTR